jgi:hypothetical protein
MSTNVAGRAQGHASAPFQLHSVLLLQSQLQLQEAQRMSDTARRSREQLLRRRAKRQGFELSKSKTRDPRALDYGTWTISDPLGVDRPRPGLTLDEVEDFLGNRPEMNQAEAQVRAIAEDVWRKHPGISQEELRQRIAAEIASRSLETSRTSEWKVTPRTEWKVTPNGP